MNYFRWENPEFLYLFICLPIFWIAIYLIKSKKNERLQKIGDINLINQQSTFQLPKYITSIRWIFISIAIIGLILGLANPQFGLQKEVLKREGIDIAIAMDISRSMLVQDIKPSRLERSKMFCSKLMDKLFSDRLAFIVFAGNSYTQMPLTADHTAAKMFLSSISTDLAPTQGTAIAEAIKSCTTTFQEGSKTSKAIIIITDGEDHEGDLEEEAKLASSMGCKIFTIGVGTDQGGPIPQYVNGSMQGFLKDEQGNTVISKLETNQLSSLAANSGGKVYKLGQNNDILEAIVSDLSKLKKTNMESKEFKNYNSYFQWMLIPCLLFLIIESLLPYIKGKELFQLNQKGN